MYAGICRYCAGTDIQSSIAISWGRTPLASAFVQKMAGNVCLCDNTVKMRNLIVAWLCKEKRSLASFEFVAVLFLLEMQAMPVGCGYIVVKQSATY